MKQMVLMVKVLIFKHSDEDVGWGSHQHFCNGSPEQAYTVINTDIQINQMSR